MYAIVANGYQGIVKTKKELDIIISIYPYPKFRKFTDESRALEFLRKHTRKYGYEFQEYGNTYKRGFVTIEYFIENDCILANINTNKLGNVFLINNDDNVVMDKRNDFTKVKVKNVVLNDLLIRHHAIAIKRLLKIIGPIVSVCIVVPDISVYLALTSYSGKDGIITSTQRYIDSRIGGISFTIRDL